MSCDDWRHIAGEVRMIRQQEVFKYRTAVRARTALGVVVGPRRGGGARQEVLGAGQELERRRVV